MQAQIIKNILSPSNFAMDSLSACVCMCIITFILAV